MALLISDDVKSMFDSSFSNMTQFNRSEIHYYVDEHRVWMRGSLRVIMSRSGRSCGNTRPRTGPECLKHGAQQQWDARFHVSAGQDAAKENPWMLQPQTPDVCRDTSVPSYHRWAEIYCMKTIQMSQFFNIC